MIVCSLGLIASFRCALTPGRTDALAGEGSNGPHRQNV